MDKAKMGLTRLAFYYFQLGHEPHHKRTGTSIEFDSLLNFLKAQPIDLQVIPCLPNQAVVRNRWQKLWVFIRQQWRDLSRLLLPKADILLFVYPKIPFTGHSGAISVILAALAGYGLLVLKTRLTSQQIVILITDLPLEQSTLDMSTNATELDSLLARFYNWRTFSTVHQLSSWLERLLLSQANAVISLSPLMTRHLIRKHHLAVDKIYLRGRNSFAPTYDMSPPVITLDGEPGQRVFYSGDLVRPTTIDNLRCIIAIFQDFPSAHFYLCGRDGAWITAEAQKLNITNVHYLGALNYTHHDAVARQCDVGLLVYTIAYANLVPTSKYSAYVGNGLAVLSTNLITLSDIITADGVGLAVPLEDFPAQLSQWLTHPELVEPYKKQAQTLSPRFKSGDYMQTWFDAIMRHSNNTEHV